MSVFAESFCRFLFFILLLKHFYSNYASVFSHSKLGANSVAVLHHTAYLQVWRIGMDLRTCAVGLVYRKALQVNK